jgi:hypothetical protein
MRKSSVASYFFAGIVLVNSLPHFVIGVTGRRNPTGFGRDSSPSVNMLWGTINIIGGCLLVRRTDRKTDLTTDSNAWLLSVLAGSLFWTLFGIVYQLRKLTDDD